VIDMATKKISQATLAEIVERRKQIADAEEQLKALEEKLTADLKSGATVALGLLTAELKQIERRNVAWRQAFEEQISKRDGDGKGKELADRILAATKPQVYESLSVKVAA
jgi:hypothetical protein